MVFLSWKFGVVLHLRMTSLFETKIYREKEDVNYKLGEQKENEISQSESE